MSNSAAALQVRPPTWNGGTMSCARWDEDEFAKRPRPYWRRHDAINVAESRDNPPTHFALIVGPR